MNASSTFATQCRKVGESVFRYGRPFRCAKYKKYGNVVVLPIRWEFIAEPQLTLVLADWQLLFMGLANACDSATNSEALVTRGERLLWLANKMDQTETLIGNPFLVGSLINIDPTCSEFPQNSLEDLEAWITIQVFPSCGIVCISSLVNAPGLAMRNAAHICAIHNKCKTEKQNYGASLAKFYADYAKECNADKEAHAALKITMARTVAELDDLKVELANTKKRAADDRDSYCKKMKVARFLLDNKPKTCSRCDKVVEDHQRNAETMRADLKNILVHKDAEKTTHEEQLFADDETTVFNFSGIYA